MTARKTNTGESVETTMRAVLRREYGSVDNVIVEEIGRPQPGSGEVLIEVHAAGVDQGVWHVMAGLPYLMRVAGFGVAHPKNPILGTDVSGRVIEIGAGVDGFAVGDEVFGFADGSYAEYVVAPADKLAHKPASLSFEQAAAVPVSGVTALQAVTEVGQVRPGQSVLVIGASGGVGSYAVQIARALGATVTGVASGEKADLVRSLGAEDVIDYRTTEYLDGSRQFDLIIDTGGLNPIRRLRKALTRKGTLVIVGGEGGGKLTGGIGRQLGATLLSPFVSHRLKMFLSSGTSELLDRLAQFLDTGDVLPAVGKQYELDRATDAISDLVTGAARGKSVITIK